MFITLSGFKGLIKEAYKGAGLYIERHGDNIIFGGSYWVIEADRHAISKKALAAVIELTGELPREGEAYRATKEGNQYEIREVYGEMLGVTQTEEENESNLIITSLIIKRKPTDKAKRILQREDRRTEALDEKFIRMVSAEEIDNDYECEVLGPMVNKRFPRQVYWRSEATTLSMFLFDRDDLKEKELLDYLNDARLDV